ncbi:MAG TPA: hypothetical protein VF916_01160 [Ktedonobacterales bacterium]
MASPALATATVLTDLNDQEPSTPLPDLRRYWYRAHQHAVAGKRRANAAYEHAWRSDAPACAEWEQLRSANRRATFCYRQLCRQMGW